MCARCEGPRHKSRNGGTLGTISQLALDPLCKQEIDKLASTRQHSIHSTVWQIDQCIPMHVTFVFLFMHGTTWHSRHLFSSSKTKLIKIVVSCKNTRKTETNVLGKKCARFMVLLEKTRVSQKCVSKTELVQVFVYQRGVQNVLFALYIFYLYISNRNVHTHTIYIYAI